MAHARGCMVVVLHAQEVADYSRGCHVVGILEVVGSENIGHRGRKRHTGDVDFFNDLSGAIEQGIAKFVGVLGNCILA